MRGAGGDTTDVPCKPRHVHSRGSGSGGTHVLSLPQERADRRVYDESISMLPLSAPPPQEITSQTLLCKVALASCCMTSRHDVSCMPLNRSAKARQQRTKKVLPIPIQGAVITDMNGRARMAKRMTPIGSPASSERRVVFKRRYLIRASAVGIQKARPVYMRSATKSSLTLRQRLICTELKAIISNARHALPPKKSLHSPDASGMSTVMAIGYKMEMKSAAITPLLRQRDATASLSSLEFEMNFSVSVAEILPSQSSSIFASWTSTLMPSIPPSCRWNFHNRRPMRRKPNKKNHHPCARSIPWTSISTNWRNLSRASEISVPECRETRSSDDTTSTDTRTPNCCLIRLRWPFFTTLNSAHSASSTSCSEARVS